MVCATEHRVHCRLLRHLRNKWGRAQWVLAVATDLINLDEIGSNSLSGKREGWLERRAVQASHTSWRPVVLESTRERSPLAWQVQVLLALLDW